MKLVKRFYRWSETRQGKIVVTVAMLLLAARQVMLLAYDEVSAPSRLFAAGLLLLLGHLIFDNLLEMMSWVFVKEDTDAELYESKNGDYVVRLNGRIQIMVAVEHIPDKWGHGAGITAVYIREMRPPGQNGGEKKEKKTVDVKQPGLKTKPAADAG